MRAYNKPKDLLNPILNILKTNPNLDKSSIISKLAEYFNLDNDFLNRRYEVSNAKIFENTVLWKLNDLDKSGLISFEKVKDKRLYFVSDLGIQLLYASSDDILKYIRENYLRKFDTSSEQEKEEITQQIVELEVNPLEQLEKSYLAIRKEIYNEIIEVLLSKSPAAFEKIVIELFQKMGYGDGEITQLSRDGGIDGIIKSDVLGFEQIYVQAKRYQKDASIGQPDIQRFIGTLLGLQGNATKGIFVTTAKFSNEAIKYVQNFSKAKIVLINGDLLAKYIYEYELGVQPQKIFSIKKLDSDFWESFS